MLFVFFHVHGSSTIPTTLNGWDVYVVDVFVPPFLTTPLVSGTHQYRFVPKLDEVNLNHAIHIINATKMYSFILELVSHFFLSFFKNSELSM